MNHTWFICSDPLSLFQTVYKCPRILRAACAFRAVITRLRQSTIIFFAALFYLSHRQSNVSAAHSFSIMSRPPPPGDVHLPRVYANVNGERPREYWDYEALAVEWGCVAFDNLSHTTNMPLQ